MTYTVASWLDIVPQVRDQPVSIRRTVRRRSPRRRPGALPDQVLGEGLFMDALLRERKRAERPGPPFALILLSRDGGRSEDGTWLPLVHTLSAVKRDIDIVGWVERGSVLGLLLPETCGRAAVAMHRVRSAIAGRLGEDAVAATTIYLYVHGDGCAPAESEGIPPIDLMLEALEQRRRWWTEAAKRCLDIAGSLALLALFAPVLLAVFAAIRCTSPGPALFRQIRIGRGGRPFTMLKFRTMDADAGHAIHERYVAWFIASSGREPRTANQLFKLTDDPRVTPAGRFLRKTSLDELPQFWNVLRGDMSLVGPRPPLPFEVEHYEPWHRRRVFEAKPGVTGPWQVNGRSRTTFDEMVRLDLRYARTHSLWTDIRILAATPRAMLSGKGAC